MIIGALIFWTLASGEQPAQFRGNPLHTGVYEAPRVNPVGHLKWKFHTNGRVISSPAVENGAVYFGATDGRLYAVEAQGGALLWKARMEASITSSPAVSGDRVFFGCYDGNFYSLDKKTGKTLWTFKTEGERRFIGTRLHGSEPRAEAMPDPFDCFLSSPTVVDGTVYFGSGDGNVYSLDEATGALNWKFKTGDVVHASPAIANGVLYVGSWDTYFYALDAKSGQVLWKFKTGEDPDIHNQTGIQSSAAVADDTVYFGCRDSNFYALDAKTGAKKWQFDNKGSWVVGSPAVRDGKVFFGTSDTSLFYEFDGASGSPVFSMEFHKWPLFSSPSIAGDRLYIGSNEGKLYSIDIAGHKLAWTFQTEACKSHARIYRKDDGTPNYEAAFSSNFYDDMIVGVNKLYEMGAIQSSPVISGGKIYFGSVDGNVYALE